MFDKKNGATSGGNSCRLPSQRRRKIKRTPKGGEDGKDSAPNAALIRCNEQGGNMLYRSK